MMASPICPRCGRELPPGPHTLCPHCAGPLGASASVAPPSAAIKLPFTSTARSGCTANGMVLVVLATVFIGIFIARTPFLIWDSFAMLPAFWIALLQLRLERPIRAWLSSWTMMILFVHVNSIIFIVIFDPRYSYFFYRVYSYVGVLGIVLQLALMALLSGAATGMALLFARWDQTRPATRPAGWPLDFGIVYLVCTGVAAIGAFLVAVQSRSLPSGVELGAILYFFLDYSVFIVTYSLVIAFLARFHIRAVLRRERPDLVWSHERLNLEWRRRERPDLEWRGHARADLRRERPDLFPPSWS